MEMTPKHAIEVIAAEAPGVLKTHKSHAPILLVFGERGNNIISIEMKDDKTKRKSMILSGIASVTLLPYCVAFVSEAWMARRFPPEGKHISDMPDKEECIAIAACDKNGHTETAAIPFSKIAGEIILGETIFSGAAESSLLNEFWHGVTIGTEKFFGR